MDHYNQVILYEGLGGCPLILYSFNFLYYFSLYFIYFPPWFSILYFFMPTFLYPLLLLPITLLFLPFILYSENLLYGRSCLKVIHVLNKFLNLNTEYFLFCKLKFFKHNFLTEIFFLHALNFVLCENWQRKITKREFVGKKLLYSKRRYFLYARQQTTALPSLKEISTKLIFSLCSSGVQETG